MTVHIEQPKLAFDEISDADLVVLVRVFGLESVSLAFDRNLNEVKRRHAVAAEAVAERAASRVGRATGEKVEIDLFYLKNRVSEMLRPYLEGDQAFDSAKDRKDTLQLAIQFYDLSQKTMAAVREYAETRDMVRAIVDNIRQSPDANNIMQRLLVDPRLRELM